MARVLNIHVGVDAQRIFGSLSANPLTRRLENRMSVSMRLAILDALRDTVIASKARGTMPFRTGRGYAKMLAGGRAFGSVFRDLRGHIVGPAYMAGHEQGAKITPKRGSSLAIPLAPALRPDGTPKLPGPRSWKLHGSFVFKAKSGRKFIARKAGGVLIFLYVLVDFVQLSKHKGFISKEWERQLPKLYDSFGKIFLQAIQGIDPETFVQAGRQAKRKI